MVKKTRFQKIFSVKVTNLTLLLIYLPMGILFFEFILHVGDADQLGRSFAWQNLIYFFFMLSFFLLMGRSLKLLIYMGILAFINLMMTLSKFLSWKHGLKLKKLFKMKRIERLANHVDDSY